MVDSLRTPSDTIVSILPIENNASLSTKSYTGTRQGLMQKDTEAARPKILNTVVPYQ
jgi:hypothetical protein